MQNVEIVSTGDSLMLLQDSVSVRVYPVKYQLTHSGLIRCFLVLKYPLMLIAAIVLRLE